MTPHMVQALATATKQWHEASRTYELCSAAFADAQTQLQRAERDLHELAKAIEVASSPAAVQSNQAAPAGTVTMPIVPAQPNGADNIDAAEIVKAEMMRMRMGQP